MFKRALGISVLSLAAVAGTADVATARVHPAFLGKASGGADSCFVPHAEPGVLERPEMGGIRNVCGTRNYLLPMIVDSNAWYHWRVRGDVGITCEGKGRDDAGFFSTSSGPRETNLTHAVGVPPWGYGFVVCTVPFNGKLTKIDYWI